MNSYEFVQKLAKKRFASRLGFQPGTKMHPGWDFNPGPKWLKSAHFIYIPYNKNTIQKSGLYDLTRMAYSQSHFTTTISYLPPLPKNVGRLISEYVDREKVLYFLR